MWQKFLKMFGEIYSKYCIWNGLPTWNSTRNCFITTWVLCWLSFEPPVVSHIGLSSNLTPLSKWVIDIIIPVTSRLSRVSPLIIRVITYLLIRVSHYGRTLWGVRPTVDAPAAQCGTQMDITAAGRPIYSSCSHGHAKDATDFDLPILWHPLPEAGRCSCTSLAGPWSAMAQFPGDPQVHAANHRLPNRVPLQPLGERQQQDACVHCAATACDDLASVWTWVAGAHSVSSSHDVFEWNSYPHCPGEAHNCFLPSGFGRDLWLLCRLNRVLPMPLAYHMLSSLSVIACWISLMTIWNWVLPLYFHFVMFPYEAFGSIPSARFRSRFLGSSTKQLLISVEGQMFESTLMISLTLQ